MSAFEFLNIQDQQQYSIEFLEVLQNAPDLIHLPLQVVLVSSSGCYLQETRTKKYPVLDYFENPLIPEKIPSFSG